MMVSGPYLQENELVIVRLTGHETVAGAIYLPVPYFPP